MALDDITRRIRAAEAAAGRAPGSVTLIAVSKLQPPERSRRYWPRATPSSERITSRRRRPNGPHGVPRIRVCRST